MSSMNSTRPVGYLPQLDGLRTVAVGLVLVWHWLPGYALPWLDGEFGVRLFFVMSGLLITGILLDARTKSEQGIGTRFGVLHAFYIRRALRIFPVYYATLFVTYALGFDSVCDGLAWHLTYTSNMLFALKGEWSGYALHLWALSVEEQFYLVWPWAVLFAPRRYLIGCAVGAIGIGVASKSLLLAAGQPVAANVLTVSALDTLGIGAFFAIMMRPEYWPEGRPWRGARARSVGGELDSATPRRTRVGNGGVYRGGRYAGRGGHRRRLWDQGAARHRSPVYTCRVPRQDQLRTLPVPQLRPASHGATFGSVWTGRHSCTNEVAGLRSGPAISKRGILALP